MATPRADSLLSGAALLAVLALIFGCASSEPRRAVPHEPATAALSDEDAPALLLLMADQLLFEPFAVRIIYREYPHLHEQLAVTLGRLGDARGLPYLESLLEAPTVEVRRAAAFALGQLGDRKAYPHLLGAVGDRDREVGRLAVEALGRLEVPLETIEQALMVLSGAEAMNRVVPVLFRFSPDEIHTYAARWDTAIGAEGSVRALDPVLERWLLFALARGGDERGLPELRQAIGSRDPWVRGWAARALGRLGERADLERLHGLLQDESAGVVVQALRAASALIDAGKAAPPEPWLADLDRLIQDRRSWIRLTALESAGSWTPNPDLGARLRSLAAARGGRAAELALLALARSGDVEAEQLILRAAASDSPSMRRAAASAAAAVGFERVIGRLRVDADPAVRMAALGAVLEASGTTDRATATLGNVSAAAEIAAREALLDLDPGIRAVAFDWLTTNPVAPLDELLFALTPKADQRMPDLQISGAAAIAARALQRSLERGAAVAALERLAESSDYLVRRAAGEALVQLDRERPRLGSIVSTPVLRDYRAVIRSMSANERAEIVTDRGTLVIALDTVRAPMTCVTFIQLAQAGFFDGLEFHRVIPDFVAQGGDPRGDGWGGPGFSLRDENSRVHYERGVVGMARSGTHTAGSQFFLTLSAQPHLDGRYTAFGRIVAGEEWLDAIEQGDTIASIRSVAAGQKRNR